MRIQRRSGEFILTAAGLLLVIGLIPRYVGSLLVSNVLLVIGLLLIVVGLVVMVLPRRPR